VKPFVSRWIKLKKKEKFSLSKDFIQIRLLKCDILVARAKRWDFDDVAAALLATGGVTKAYNKANKLKEKNQLLDKDGNVTALPMACGKFLNVTFTKEMRTLLKKKLQKLNIDEAKRQKLLDDATEAMDGFTLDPKYSTAKMAWTAMRVYNQIVDNTVDSDDSAHAAMMLSAGHVASALESLVETFKKKDKSQDRDKDKPEEWKITKELMAQYAVFTDVQASGSHHTVKASDLNRIKVGA
jgi:hypothetical protein